MHNIISHGIERNERKSGNYATEGEVEFYQKLELLRSIYTSNSQAANYQKPLKFPLHLLTGIFTGR